MKVIRFVLAIAIFASVAFFVQRHMGAEYSCDVAKKSADRHLYRAFRGANESERVAIGRAMLQRLQPCLAHDPFDYQLKVSYGMAADAAGQKDLAMEMYRSALALNERPEILANIAELQFESGQPEEATKNLLRAASFHIGYVRKVGEPMRSEIIAAVKERARQLLKAKNRPENELQIPRKRP